jgi:hypothetical protein
MCLANCFRFGILLSLKPNPKLLLLAERLYGAVWSFYISKRMDRSKSAEMGEFFGSHRADALYQGTTSIGPMKPDNEL